MINRFAWTLAWLAITGVASVAHADCFTPEPALLWSYPADGAVDVPTNAELWFLSTLAALAPATSVTLNGKAVPASPASPTAPSSGQITLGSLHFTPGEATANTAYAVEVTIAPIGSQPENKLKLRFTTGAGPAKAKAPKGARVTARFAEPPELSKSEPCAQLIAVQGCFDTVEAEPPLVHRLALEPGDAIAWFVRADQPDGSMLWPASCGAPRVFLRHAKPDECLFVQAISPGGLLEPETRYCAKASAKYADPTPGAVDLKPVQPKLAAVAAAQPARAAVPVEPPSSEPAAPEPPAAEREPKSGWCAVSDVHSSSSSGASAALLALSALLVIRRRASLG